MGPCNCSTEKNPIEQTKHQIPAQSLHQSCTEPLQNSINVRTLQPKTCLSETKRRKNALLLETEQLDLSDNIHYCDSLLSESDKTEIRKTLNKHFIFSQLSPSEIDCFIKEIKPCTAHANSYLFRQGDRSGSYYIILEGLCQVEINNKKSKTLTYGDSFGDLAIVYSAPRSASVLALTDCELVQISRSHFRKVMADINQLHEKENKKLLSVLTFFKDLTEQQKNAIAATCLTETYNEGQLIFNQGDDANSFYVIKHGIVLVKEKKQKLKSMDCFGQNSILMEGGIRSNTLVARTRCVLLSMSRQNIKTSLGDTLKNVIKKNMLHKVLAESKLMHRLDEQKLTEAIDQCQFLLFRKGEVVLTKDTEYTHTILVLLNSPLNGLVQTYSPNCVIEAELFLSKIPIQVKEDMSAVQDGLLAKITYNFDSALTTRYSLNHHNAVQLQPSTTDRQPSQKKMQIGDFHVIRKLRQGNFAKVYLCHNHKTEKLYAIKVLDRTLIEKTHTMPYVTNEEEALRKIPKSPLIVGFHKLLKDSNFIYLVMDFIEGEDLFDVITKLTVLPPALAASLVSQMLLMLQHLHHSQFIYRDLKPENLMMNTEGYLVLVDMGTAKKLSIDHRFKTNTIIGTAHYMAPEIVIGKGYSFPADLWSLGIVTYELVCGKLPFGQNQDDPFTIYEQIVNSPVKYPRTCLADSKSFIETLLNKNPQHRIADGLESLKKHSFFSCINWTHIANRTAEMSHRPGEELKVSKSDIQNAFKNQTNKAPDRFLADKSSK